MRILTFDVEDWFHVLDNPSTDSSSVWPGLESRVERNTDRILGELALRDTRATFFCLGWVAEHHPGVVRRIAAAGHDVGTHSHAHLPLPKQERHEFGADLVRSIRLLEDLTGKPVTCYRAPGFTLSLDDEWALDRLIASGIAVDCSMFPFRRGNGGRSALLGGPFTIETSCGRVRELPVSSARLLGVSFVCSGAGYFRLLPYGVVRDQLLRDAYAMTYFHPRDFDATQPVVDGLSFLRRFKARVGLRSALGNFRRLLDEFDFVSVSQAVQQIDWGAAPVVRLPSEPVIVPPLGQFLPGWLRRVPGTTR